MGLLEGSGLIYGIEPLTPGPGFERFAFSKIHCFELVCAATSRRTLPSRVRNTPGYSDEEKRRAIARLRLYFQIAIHPMKKISVRWAVTRRNSCAGVPPRRRAPPDAPVPNATMRMLLTLESGGDGGGGGGGGGGRGGRGGDDANARLSATRFMKILANSRASLSLRGDGPTTERDASVFETLTLKVELASNVDALISDLPFGAEVPWRVGRDNTHAVLRCLLGVNVSDSTQYF